MTYCNCPDKKACSIKRHVNWSINLYDKKTGNMIKPLRFIKGQCTKVDDIAHRLNEVNKIPNTFICYDLAQAL